MKKFIVSAVIVAVLGGVGFFLWNRNAADREKAPQPPEPKTQKQLVADEIRQWIEGGKKQKTFSQALVPVIEADPDFVIVHLGVHEAKNFPGISDDDAKKILASSEEDSARAVKDLQRCIYDNLSTVIKEYKGTSDKNWRQGWNNNNHATAILLIKVPLAERIGKKQEMLTDELCGKNFKWMKDIPGPYNDWWYDAIWPWPNESPPWYWGNEKR